MLEKYYNVGKTPEGRLKRTRSVRKPRSASQTCPNNSLNMGRVKPSMGQVKLSMCQVELSMGQVKLSMGQVEPSMGQVKLSMCQVEPSMGQVEPGGSDTYAWGTKGGLQ